jgi:hypothetical protein
MPAKKATRRPPRKPRRRRDVYGEKPMEFCQLIVRNDVPDLAALFNEDWRIYGTFDLPQSAKLYLLFRGMERKQ